ncbi:MAG TPA: hypothetical protein VLA61_03115 [Ideonella sp.]|uniref:hypothetical protein n=1 Tax=Ideonella sp. TaxID=1929293 RepID=UPI002BF83693|nr:hypothetical protein [Ideonella sp.]HSI47235.1 hypothetical protein [Ideonella sp.]
MNTNPEHSSSRRPESASGAPRDSAWFEGIQRGLWIGLAAAAVILPVQYQLRQHRLADQRAAVAMAPNAEQAPAALQPQAPVSAVPPPVRAMVVDWHGESASEPARKLAQWVAASHNNEGMDFVIVDKHNTKVFVFASDGQLKGATPVLLGSKVGDDSVPGIGQKPIADVRPDERTTPAGRFLGQRGMNAINQDVVWVDYAAAVSMHRVRTTNASERRLERLATPTTADNRISYGCINMPVAFFEQVLAPTFARQRAVVYVLPEVKSLQTVFGIPDQFDAPPVTATADEAPVMPKNRSLRAPLAAAALAAKG